MKRIVIFGTNDFAQLAAFYLRKEPNCYIVGFTLNKEFKKEEQFEGCPVYSWEELEEYQRPQDIYLFAPLADNKLRAKIYREGRSRGYKFISYVSPKCTNFSQSIGDNCFIFEDNTLQPFTKIGDNVIMWSGNHLGHHSTIEDNVFISSHVVISGHCRIREGAWLGVNSTIRDQTIVGANCILGMGSVLTKNLPDNETWIGSPAKKK